MAQGLDIRQKAKWRRAMYAKPTILLLLVIFSLLLGSTWRMFEKSALAGQKAATADAALSELKSRESALSEDIVGLSSERGVEEQIRERFMVAKDGEKVIVISDTESTKPHTVIISEEPDR